MKRGRDYIDYLSDILDAIEKAGQFIEGMDLEHFSSDNKTRFAVIRALEIIGEASKKLPDKVKRQNPELPWREIGGIRDKLIHEYFGLSLEVIWKTLKEDLPKMKPVISSMLEEAFKQGDKRNH